MTSLRVLLISVLLVLGAAVPLAAGMVPVPPAHSTVSRVAEGPTRTPMPIRRTQGPCPGMGC